MLPFDSKKKNKSKSSLKWQYHEKFKEKYESYLKQNMNKNNIRLKGNYHYQNKSLNYYLSNKESEPIKNTNLTPLPQSKYLNQKTKEKNFKDYQEFLKIQKSVIEMRRIEYKTKLIKKKIKKKEINQIIEEKKNNDIDNNNNNNNNENIKEYKSSIKRNSCIQFHHSIILEKKRKTLNISEIKKYILENINNLNTEQMPKEVKNYYKKFISCVIKIQQRYKKHYKFINKILKIQSTYKAHLYYKLFKIYLERKTKIEIFIYIIQKVLFLNLYYLKINPGPKYASKKIIITKNIYTVEFLSKIIFIQREIKNHLFCKKLKRLYPKKKCVYVKPYTINPLNKIRLLQRNIVIFLERLNRRHKVQKSKMIVKKIDFSKKIILIQRLARSIHNDIIFPPIPKDTFSQDNFFVKSNRRYAKKKSSYINTIIIPFRKKNVNIKIKSKNALITKSHKYLKKIIFIQRFIKIYLSRDDYDTYDYPKIEEYFTKQSNFLPHKESILYLQSVIKYYLYRQKIRIYTIHKKVINPLKCTKTIKTNTEKIFTRLSKLRIQYDKNMIIFFVKFIEVIKKYLGRVAYEKIKEESKNKKKFLASDEKDKTKEEFDIDESNLNKHKHIIKIIEPEYNLEFELQKNKNNNTKDKKSK